MMYNRTAKQIKIIALVSFIISTIATVIVFMIQHDDDFSSTYWIIPAAPLIWTFSLMSCVLNFKKNMIGLIKPIPILSMVIEYFKGYIYGVKALIWALKQPKNNGTGTNVRMR